MKIKFVKDSLQFLCLSMSHRLRQVFFLCWPG